MAKVKQKLEQYGQEHLLDFYDTLSHLEKERLIEDIKKIDFPLMERLYKLACSDIKKLDYTLSKMDNVYVKDSLNQELAKEWINKGENIIKSKKFAVITMAGGQGTRLGHDGPKGTFYLDTINGKKSIFEILIDKLIDARRKYNISIPWYIMTSIENNDETISFFERNNYFGYGKENIIFFTQGVLPMLDEKGKIILETKSNVKFASDGNGGIFNSLKDNVIHDLMKKNIEYVYISGVDNILVNFVDELFIGGMKATNKEIASKSVLKEKPNEKVGVICKKNNLPCVVEYSEIPDNVVGQKKENGELYFCEANIVSNIYSVKLLKELLERSLPYHVAKKKCDILNANGIKEISDTPNAYKFEMFIFDSYAYVDDIFVLRVKRDEEFAPVKNKEGEDSPESACKLYNEFILKKDSVI